MKETIACERCGGIAIRSPLCGSCAYALAVPTWERIKLRASTTVSDQVLDHWMDLHPNNPANLEPDPTNKEQERHEDGWTYEKWRDTASG